MDHLVKERLRREDRLTATNDEEGRRQEGQRASGSITLALEKILILYGKGGKKSQMDTDIGRFVGLLLRRYRYSYVVVVI